jgi:hypothetical protein
MTFYTSSLPLWSSVLLLLTFPIAFVAIANMVKQGLVASKMDPVRIVLFYKRILVYGFIYLFIVAILSLTGVVSVNAFPPRIFIFTTIPLILFYMFYVSRTAWYKLILTNLSLSSLVKIHIVRLLGVFFLIGYYYHALPAYFAITGGVGDLFAALSSIFVVYALKNKKQYAIKLVYVWNVIGLLDIINVAITAIVSTRLSLTAGTQSIIEITYFPYCWIPAFAPATIVFLHISIFTKLKMLKFLTN